MPRSRGISARPLVAVLVALLLLSPASAQDGRGAARDLVKKWQDAIVNVRIVLKTRMSMAGREMQSTDDTVEAVGTVIDSSGLTVLALGSLNPGGMIAKLMGSAGGDQRVDIASEPTDVRIRFPDGHELPAAVALRDEDLNLAFIRPRKKPEKPLVFLDLANAGKPALLDQVVVLSRLGQVGGWSTSASLQDIGAIIEKPRTFFVLGGTGSSGMGTPAFLLNGKVVGVLTLRQVEAGRASMFSGMGGTEGMGLLPVILPAADVLEIAQQATEKDPK